MIVTFTIFILALASAFGMLFFRAWEIRTARVTIEDHNKYTPRLHYRHVEKVALHLAKHIIQWIILSTVKTWFIAVTKSRIWIQNKLPKIHDFFCKRNSADSRKISFLQRAIIESKIKIKRVKEKIKKEHEEIMKEGSEVDNL